MPHRCRREVSLRLSFVISAAVALALVACADDDNSGSNSAEAEPAVMGAATRSELPYDECVGLSEDTFSLRVVYDVKNTYKVEELREKGAPAHVRGITRRELLMRGDIEHSRLTGKTYMRDPAKFDAWQEEWDRASDQNMSSEAFLAFGLAWEARGRDIPLVVVPIDWVERREPGGLSFRYGLVPGAPNQGERWRDDPRPDLSGDNLELARDALESTLGSIAERAAAGYVASPAVVAGIECEMLRKTNGGKTHELCHANMGGRTVHLHSRDVSASGETSEIAVEVQQGLCISDDMLSAPSRVKFENYD